MTENKRFNCHVKFSAMPNGIMVLDYEKHGDEQTVIEDVSREKAHRVMDRLNELNDENEQLKQRNDRQYNQLKQLWELIEDEDYNTLRSMLNQRETDEKLLQKEWGTYSD